MSEEKEACPWCRKTDSLEVQRVPYYSRNDAKAVTCVRCDAWGPKAYDDESAVYKWNTRQVEGERQNADLETPQSEAAPGKVFLPPVSDLVKTVTGILDKGREKGEVGD